MQQLLLLLLLQHCDLKPDNFVLSTSEASDNLCRGSEGGDLMLVDFGRAVDLTIQEKEGADAMQLMFTGNAARKDMQCVAMRSGNSWSFDVDTHGILCSAHVLLFGTHMEIERTEDDKWQPVSRFRRYWQRDLWMEIFHSLLNHDSVSGTAIGSRPRSLRALRGRIDEYLLDQKAHLCSAINRQAAFLPSSRDQLN
jgi:checkpoint serine/threonine-protein kinase